VIPSKVNKLLNNTSLNKEIVFMIFDRLVTKDNKYILYIYYILYKFSYEKLFNLFIFGFSDLYYNLKDQRV
jgi:hypothetical protein